MTTIVVCLYNLALVAGTAYLVAVYDWSPWWFVLTIMFMANIFKGEKDERKN